MTYEERNSVILDTPELVAHIHEHLNTIAANQAAAVTDALDTLARERLS